MRRKRRERWRKKWGGRGGKTTEKGRNRKGGQRRRGEREEVGRRILFWNNIANVCVIN